MFLEIINIKWNINSSNYTAIVPQLVDVGQRKQKYGDIQNVPNNLLLTVVGIFFV